MAETGWLRQNTAITVKIGPFTLVSDGDGEATGLTINQADVRLSKNGGAGAQKNDTNACTHDEKGMYNCSFNTTDTNTPGALTLYVHVATALIVRHDYLVVAAPVYDALVSGTEWLGVDAFRSIWSIAGYTLTVKKPDGVTLSESRTLSTNPNATPVTGSS
jgi:hypothetical protein